jgi:hypothetical protein
MGTLAATAATLATPTTATAATPASPATAATAAAAATSATPATPATPATLRPLRPLRPLLRPLPPATQEGWPAPPPSALGPAPSGHGGRLNFTSHPPRVLVLRPGTGTYSEFCPGAAPVHSALMIQQKQMYIAAVGL